VTYLDESLAGLAGTLLADKYQLNALLGSGGMGVVYQAEQVGLGRSVAIKLLRRDLIATRFDWFRAEAMAASRINHPHAVAIYDFGVTADGNPFLVMEHLRGRTLSSLIENDQLSVERIVKIGGQILSALTEAHACGVIHCDLTGDNVIVERLRAGDDFAKVIDFGLARLFESSPSAGKIIGTAEYMAPEQIRGELISPATDLYAVGVLLFEMIVGRTPFAGSAIPTVLDGHLNAQPTPPHQVVPDCPPALSELVLRALSKRVEARPQSAAEMREALLAIAPSAADRAPASPPLARPPIERPPVATGSTPLRQSTTFALQTRRTSRLSCELGRPPSSLIGRGEELGRLIALGHGEAGGTLTLVGPSGIGKGRLVTELGRRMAPRQRTFVAGADPSGLKASWFPILGLLEQVLELSPPIEVAQLSKAVARVGLPDRDVPGLAELFGLPSAFSNLELAVRRREANAAALRALLAVGRRFPRAVLALTDVDQFDHPSRQLVEQLAREAPARDLRLVLTSRKPLDLGGEVVVVAPLTPATSRELVVAVANSKHVPDGRSLFDLTGGVPEALEQVAGWLARGNSAADLPSLLVDLMSIRINRLDVAARRVLQAVAVHGNVASRSLVIPALNAGEVAAIDTVEWHGLLVVEPDVLTIPSPLLASVVWASTPADVRRRLHWRAFEALGDGGPPGPRAHHAEHAGELRRAFDLYLRAGHDAARRFDDPGAAAWYGRAVATARELHARGVYNAAEELVDASLLLAEILRLCGQHGLALGTLDEAALHGTSDRQRAVADRVRGLIALATGDPAKAVDWLQQAVGAALRAGQRNMLCQTYIDLADALHGMGDLERAIAELDQAIDVITLGEGMKTVNPPDRLWRVGKALAEKLQAAGRLPEAREMALAALAHARRLGWQHAQGRISALLASICEAAGDAGSALRFRANAIDEMRKLGDRRSTAELLIESVHAAKKQRPVSENTPVATWIANPDETLRLAVRLAAEIGWDEGLAVADEREG
jgi:serine/threonine-protein kinase